MEEEVKIKVEDPVLKQAYNENMRIYQKERYHNNPEYRAKVLASNKRWRENNHEKVRDIQKRYFKKRYLNDPAFKEKTKERNKLNYLKRKEKENAIQTM